MPNQGRVKKTIVTILTALAFSPAAQAQLGQPQTWDTQIFWQTAMQASNDISRQVNQFSDANNLRPLPLSYTAILSNTVTLNGNLVYTSSPNDDLCGAPAGAVASVSVWHFATNENLMELPGVKEHMARIGRANVGAQATAARSTQQQRELLREAQGGHESSSQRNMADFYQRQLEASLAQSMTKGMRDSIVSEYAETINRGFAQMSSEERCVWATGVYAIKNLKVLDQALGQAKSQATAQSRSSALGFGGPSNPQPILPFDAVTAMNTILMAKELEQRAFQLGRGATAP